MVLVILYIDTLLILILLSFAAAHPALGCHAPFDLSTFFHFQDVMAVEFAQVQV